MLRRRRINQCGKILLDIVALGSALWLAFLIRFEGSLPETAALMLARYLPWIVASKVVLLALAGRYRVAWRYTGLRDTISIFVWCVVAAAVLLGWRFLSGVWQASPGFLPAPVPLSVILTDLVLSFGGLCGARIGVRLYYERKERCLPMRGEPSGARNLRSRAKSAGDGGATKGEGPVPTLLIGAGRVGASVAREIKARRNIGILPVGFLDDDVNLVGMNVEGIPVLGTTAHLRTIAIEQGARQALITIAGASGQLIRRIVRACEASGLTTQIVPALSEIVEGRVNLSRIRKVDIHDLLRRPPVQLDIRQVRETVGGQIVLITGAGGSIGSELCRIVGSLGPSTLVLVERSENNLFTTHRQLAEMFPTLRIVPCIADICDEIRMESIFAAHRPSLVFHAAAHKHVPMMEWNPSEAVKNNVLGTRTIASLADSWEVERFVMISTDKAVNPTSVMGVSKRVAEMWVQSFSKTSSTKFITVRFGNVLGSAGSVIPIFEQQIASGGPVTVTHPEMTRYVMTIPEACQLVLQAGCMGKGGEIFILDMGEPVKILDIARDLIRLSGLSPDRDVEIRFTGIRPGEKLYEELFLGEETARKTRHPRIFVGQARVPEWIHIDRQVTELGELADGADASAICDKFKEIVPEYQYQGLRHDPAANPLLQPSYLARVPVEESANDTVAMAQES